MKVEHVLLAVVIGLWFLVLSWVVVYKGRVFLVESGSMEPSIPQLSVILVAPAQRYGSGDVVTFEVSEKARFEDKGLYTTHRIVEVKRESNADIFVTKGDANEVVDVLQVSEQDIVGKVYGSFPYLGDVVLGMEVAVNFLREKLLSAAAS